MILMGDKFRVREIMMELNIFVVFGLEFVLKIKEEVLEVVREIGYFVMIKVLSGGGGKGMRIVRKEEEFFLNFDMVSLEVLVVFFNSDLYMEKFIENFRYIEV